MSMMKRIFPTIGSEFIDENESNFLLSLLFLVACSSDDIVTKEKNDLWNMVKNLKPETLSEVVSNTNKREVKNSPLAFKVQTN